MAISDVAVVALQKWPLDDAVRMTAIAGAESAYNRTARGDTLASFPAELQALYKPYACQGYLSIGYWQVFMGVWHGYLQDQTRSPDPCIWSYWLMNEANNAKAARHIWGRQGYPAWSTYNGGQYKRHLVAAWEAVDNVLRYMFSPGKPPTPAPQWVLAEAGAAPVPPPPPLGSWVESPTPTDRETAARAVLNHLGRATEILKRF